MLASTYGDDNLCVLQLVTFAKEAARSAKDVSAGRASERGQPEGLGFPLRSTAVPCSASRWTYALVWLGSDGVRNMQFDLTTRGKISVGPNGLARSVPRSVRIVV